MGGCLHLKHLKTMLWSQKFKYKIWIRSEQWLLSYNPFARRLGGWGWLVKSDYITTPTPSYMMGLSSGPSVAI
jgi:hypothetical protein